MHTTTTMYVCLSLHSLDRMRKGQKGGEKSSRGRVISGLRLLSSLSNRKKHCLHIHSPAQATLSSGKFIQSQQWQVHSIVTSVISIILPPLPYNVIAEHWANHRMPGRFAWRMQNKASWITVRVYI